MPGIQAHCHLYGVPGWGSVLVEAALVRIGLPYTFEDVAGFDGPGPARDRLLAVNPIAQVPVPVLPDGLIMTESAAILLHLAETYLEAGLAPPVGDPLRPVFLRRLIWLVTAVYGTFLRAAWTCGANGRTRLRPHRGRWESGPPHSISGSGL